MNNIIHLIGRVGQQPKTVNFAQSGKKVVKFSLAVKEYGKEQDTTLWLEIEDWNGIGDRVLSSITRGREIAVTGKLALATYAAKNANGEVHNITKPVVRLASFYLCGKKPQAQLNTEEALAS